MTAETNGPLADERAAIRQAEELVASASLAFYEERGDLSNTGGDAECAWVDAVFMLKDVLARAARGGK